eukprot:CAMPEP_0178530510 /NCGR_PEP_ID=MMETSP0696-20121128/32933_1 /TAXON_ID=265572 /ORGANISM="Extubocellulus spinifer, Strain CCMP396" /LENGTH=308 /DNA_ID=CAMNT_0020162353 /DNA_START=1 /DNA_END=923 /DNA_ORIENTATION=-
MKTTTPQHQQESPSDATTTEAGDGWSKPPTPGRHHHVPATSSGFELFSCSDSDGYDGRGQQVGVRATRPYGAGEEILRERPCMRICTAHAARSSEEAESKFESALRDGFDSLSSVTAAAVMDLSSYNEQEFDGDTDNAARTPQGIFKTNSYKLGDEVGYGGLFLTVARMNHSCRPNAAHHWRPDLHMMVVHAARDIGVGEEICTCYGPGECRDTEARRSFLRERYSFECECDMCTEGNDAGGDDRMAAIGAFHDTIPLYIHSKPDDEQGIGHPKGPYVAPILHYGYQICLAGLHDEVRASSYLARELV